MNTGLGRMLTVPFLALALVSLVATTAAADAPAPQTAYQSSLLTNDVLIDHWIDADGRLHARYTEDAIDRAYAQAQAAGLTWTHEEFQHYLENPPFDFDQYMDALQDYGYEPSLSYADFLRVKIAQAALGPVWDYVVVGWIIESEIDQTEEGEQVNWDGVLDELEGVLPELSVGVASEVFWPIGLLHNALDTAVGSLEWWISDTWDRWGINNQCHYYQIQRDEWQVEDPYNDLYVDDDGYLILPDPFTSHPYHSPYTTDYYTPEVVEGIALNYYADFKAREQFFFDQNADMAEWVNDEVLDVLAAVDSYSTADLNEVVPTSEFSGYVTNLGSYVLTDVFLTHERWLLDSEMSDTLEVLDPGDGQLLDTKGRFALEDADSLEFDVLGYHMKLPYDGVLRDFMPSLLITTDTGDPHPGLAPETVLSSYVEFPLEEWYSCELDWGDGAPARTSQNTGYRQFAAHTYDSPGEYTQTLTVDYGNREQEVIEQTVVVGNPITPALPLIVGTANVPPETQVFFSAAGTECACGGPLSYEWDFDYAPGSFTPDAAGQNVTHAFNAIGTHAVAFRATYSADIFLVVVDEVEVREPVKAYFETTLTPQGEDVLVGFDALPGDPFSSLSELGPIVSFEWDFGGGQTATGSTASHTFPAGHVGDVVLIVTDDHGYTDEEVRTLNLSVCGALEPPANVQASDDRPDGILITWECTGAGFDGFKIERDGVLVHFGLDSNERDFLDTGMLPNDYSYSVCAYGDFGDGPAGSAIGTRPGTVVSGEIDSDTTWRLTDAPIFVTDWLGISGDGCPRLTIEPGVTVYVAEEVGITVNDFAVSGEIMAVGTRDAPITFTSLSGALGGWRGLCFYPVLVGDDGASLFEYCVIENASSANIQSYFWTSQPVLRHCTIRFANEDGMVTWGSLIDSCSITGNGRDGVVFAAGCTSAVVLDSEIADNARYGARVEEEDVSAAIQGCTLSGNGGGPIRMIRPSCLDLSGNLYSGNGFEAIVVDGGHWDPATLRYDGGGEPYYVPSDASIYGEEVPRLTIEPGVTVLFGTEADLQIGYYSHLPAELHAVGTPELPITFTSLSGSPDGWKGLYFDNGSDEMGATSILEHCIVENAGYGHDANITCNYTTQPSLRHCTIRSSSSDGIRLFGAFADSCTITGNARDGIAFNSQLQDTARLLNSRVSGNGRYGIRSWSYQGSGEVHGCTITGNGDAPIWMEYPYSFDLSGNSYSGNGFEAIVVEGGHSGTATWHYDESGEPYYVPSDISIYGEEVPRLTIEPGVTVLFGTEADLQIGYYSHLPAELHAVGTPELPITFTSLSGSPDGWKGLYFDNGSDEMGATSILEHCIVENAGYGHDANITCNYTASPSIQDCILTRSSAAGLRLVGSAISVSTSDITECSGDNVLTTQSQAQLNHCLISHSPSGFGVNATSGPTPILTCCDVWGNTGGNYGGVISDQTGINGNISEDPLLCDLESGDLHLREGSPCIDGYGCGQIGAFGPGCTHCDGMEPWTPLAGALPDSTRDVAVAACGEFLYASGGLKAGGIMTNQVLYTRALGPFTDPWAGTLALPDSVRDHRLVTVQGRLHSIGGSEGAVGAPEWPVHREVHDEVWSASMAEDGSIVAWEAQASLPAPLWGAGAAVWEDHIYVVGGSSRDSVLAMPSDAIYQATVDPQDGSIAEWNTAGLTLPAPLTSAGVVTCDGRLWVIGGQSGPPDNEAVDGVRSVEILPDGTLGSAWIEATPLPEPRHSFGLAVGPGDTLCVVGGVDSTGLSSRSIFRAGVGPDGTLGDWEVCSNGVPAVPGLGSTVGVSNMDAVYHDCHIYAVGGYACSAAPNHGFLDCTLIGPLLACTATSVPASDGEQDAEEEQPAVRFALSASHPNPFCRKTSLTYFIPSPGAAVDLTIYDLAGRVVRTLVDGMRQSGRQEIVWDGLGDDGRATASGVYFCRLTAGEQRSVRKLLRLR